MYISTTQGSSIRDTVHERNLKIIYNRCKLLYSTLSILTQPFCVWILEKEKHVLEYRSDLDFTYQLSENYFQIYSINAEALLSEISLFSTVVNHGQSKDDMLSLLEKKRRNNKNKMLCNTHLWIWMKLKATDCVAQNQLHLHQQNEDFLLCDSWNICRDRH